MKKERKRILLVENENNWRNALRDLLIDYDLHSASTYAEARENLEKNETYDLLIINLNLLAEPDMHRDRLGLKLLSKIREENYPAPCIIITGDPDIQVRNWIRQYDVHDIFVKGNTNLDRFCESVKEALEIETYRRDRVFISYSHKDKKWLERLQVMLKPLIRNGSVKVWDDTNIQAGRFWKEEIKKALDRAKVAVLLVSPDFLASDFIVENELPELLDNADVSVLWVALSACLYRETEIAKYQAINDPSKPLDKLSKPEQNKVLVRICDRIKQEIGT